MPSVANPLNRISVIAVAAALLGTCSCLSPTGYVNLEYVSPSPATKVAEAGSPHVAVEVADKRPTQVVGHEFNGVGMPTSDILSDTDVPGTLKGAIEMELTNRGFALGSGGNLVSVTLKTLQSQFTWAGSFSNSEGTTAEMVIDVAVKRPEGAIAYDKFITARNQELLLDAPCPEADMQKHRAQLTARLLCNARDTLDAAMQDAVSKIFSDGTFIEILRKP